MPVGEIVHRNDDTVAAIDYVRAYPNGFTLTIGIHTNPRDDGSAGADRVAQGRRRPRRPRRALPARVGIRFADGRTAGRTATGGPHDTPRDADGIPTEPIIQMMGGGGGSHSYRFDFWVFPLPPDGPVEIFVALPAVSDDEVKVVVDGGTIREAATRAVVDLGLDGAE